MTFFSFYFYVHQNEKSDDCRSEYISNHIRALADKNRLRFIKILQQKDLCDCEITAVLGLATSTVFNHLSILKKSEIIGDGKNGKCVELLSV